MTSPVCRTGMIGEAVFVAEAMKNDVGVAIVLDQHCPYDVISICGNKMNRIQIKTTKDLELGKDGCRRSGYCVITDGTKYGADMFDYWAIVVLDVNIFYIIPQSVITKNKIRIHPDKTASNSLITEDYSMYRNRWDLLKT